MSLKVIGAGFGRTGTMSLKIALEQLGFGPCYHMIEAFGIPGAFRQWTKAALGEPVDWEQMFQGFASAVDFPACAFYRELAQRYPEAKVILTERDPESWCDSAQATIFNPATAERIGGLPEMDEMMGALMGRVFGSGFGDRERMIAVYRRHNAAVKRDIPRENLLVYNPAEGWEPLSAFLGVKAPAAPFPKTNLREDFAKMAAGLLDEHGRPAH
jgi:hypothetical protein